ncbi:MAG TPA: DUF3857 domain-containing protein [Candidatus Angelobacter sp.]|nr:DUF3857 domain-containing protein [Candidatus Angelobacter sp.]
MLRVRLCYALLCVLTCIAPHSLFALDDWQPVTQEDLKLTSADVHGANAIILYREEVSDDNRRSRTEYIRTKILTEKGKDYANVELVYSGKYFHINDLKARAIAPDGTITPFTGKAFDKTIVKGQGVKYLAKSFTIPNVQVGGIIEYRYAEYWDEGQLFAAHWVIQKELAQRHAKFTFAPYKGGNVEDDRGNRKDRVYYSLFRMPQNTFVKTTPDGKMQMELSDIPAVEEEEFAPPEGAWKWRVNFYYGDEKMAKSADFWKDEGKYWNKEVERFIGHSSTVAAAAAATFSPSDTPEQKVRKIYAFVQKLDNRTYEGKDFLEGLRDDNTKEKPKAEKILNSKSGTGDQLTRLFVAMVRSAGLPAFVMRVGTRNETFFDPNVPNFDQLNAEVAVVNLGDKEVFLDPGTRYCPFGLLEWSRTGVKGLRQTASGQTELAQTPAPEYNQTIIRRSAKLALDEEGNLKGKVTLAWEGQDALEHRQSAFHTDEAGRKKELEEELKALLPNGAAVSCDSSQGWDDLNGPVSATFTIEIPGFAASTGKRLLFPSSIFQVNNRLRFNNPERKEPVYFRYPYRSSDVVDVSLPPAMRVESLPQGQPVKTDFAYYQAVRNVKENTLSFRREFAIAGFIFAKSYYPALRTFYQGVKAGDGEQIVLSTAAKQQGGN